MCYMKKIYICGLVRSAKGTLRYLLDGHPKIINYPFDLGASLLEDNFVRYLNTPEGPYFKSLFSHPTTKKIFIKISEKYKPITIGTLFVYLFNSNRKYRDIFDVSLSGKKPGPYCTDDNSIGELLLEDYQFDVFGFLERFVNEILSIGKFDSIEHLQDTLYNCIIHNCKSMNGTSSDTAYFLQSSLNGYPIIENILERNRERKIIAVVRDPLALCYSNTKGIIEKAGRTDMLSQKVSSFFLTHIYNSFDATLYHQGFMKKVKSFNENVCKLERKERDVHIVKTEDIILNTKTTMDGIADFLGIERKDILYKVTTEGRPIQYKATPILGKIIDDPYSALSKRQIQIFKYLYGEPDTDFSIYRNGYLALQASKWKIIKLALKSKIIHKSIRHILRKWKKE